jgi:hypothetical protein
MNFKKITPGIAFIAGAILFGAVMRLVPHWPNFTPVAAMALFAGASIRKKHLAFLIPFAALLLSDLILGFHSLMLAVYLSFALVVLLGSLLHNRIKAGTLLAASVGSSLLFFLITNFAVWVGSPFYTQSFAGLMQSYTMGLPFLLNGLMGDLFYTAVFFGSFYILQQRYPAYRRI